MRRSATAALITLAPPVRLATAAAHAPTTADQLVKGKDERLVVHSAGPFEFETPLPLLSAQALTPKELLFVRNNQDLAGSATLDPIDASDWKIELAGMVEYPRVFDVKSLAALPQVETEMVLQCSGNGRAYFSLAAPASGSQWQDGAVANVRFGGVTLRSLVEALKPNIHSAARYLTAEGRDAPSSAAAADFEHSLPLADALDRSLIVTRLNGEPLPGVHGGPVRLATPGYYGTMHVKWLGRLRFEAHETTNHHQVARYRTPLAPIKPGSAFEYRLDNSEPNWRMRIKSVITAPLDGQQLPAGRAELRGLAWNDGAAAIDAVEVSLNGGRTWRRAELEKPTSPYAWYVWRATVSLATGRRTILCRAIDTLGRTQPSDGVIHWNPAGYAWHGVHAIHVDVT